MSADLPARVARGMAVLDERLPGWDRRIDVDALDLAAPNWRPGQDCGCVLAQLDYRPERSGDYFRLLRRLTKATDDAEEDAWSFDHGFIAYDDQAGYALTQAWRDAISARRATP